MSLDYLDSSESYSKYIAFWLLYLFNTLPLSVRWDWEKSRILMDFWEKWPKTVGRWVHSFSALPAATAISGACKTLPPAQPICESATYDHQLIRPQFFLWSYSLQPLTTNTQRQLLHTTSQYVATPKLKYFSFLSLFWGVSGHPSLLIFFPKPSFVLFGNILPLLSHWFAMFICMSPDSLFVVQPAWRRTQEIPKNHFCSQPSDRKSNDEQKEFYSKMP